MLSRLLSRAIDYRLKCFDKTLPVAAITTVIGTPTIIAGYTGYSSKIDDGVFIGCFSGVLFWCCTLAPEIPIITYGAYKGGEYYRKYLDKNNPPSIL